MSLENILGLDKILVKKFKQLFLLLNMSFKLPLKIIYLVKKERKTFWLNEDGPKQMLTMNCMEKQITRMYSTSENITYLVDDKTNLCQHNKLHPLTAIRGK